VEVWVDPKVSTRGRVSGTFIHGLLVCIPGHSKDREGDVVHVLSPFRAFPLSSSIRLGLPRAVLLLGHGKRGICICILYFKDGGGIFPLRREKEKIQKREISMTFFIRISIVVISEKTTK